jgi:hypothetical protein
MEASRDLKQISHTFPFGKSSPRSRFAEPHFGHGSGFMKVSLTID